MSKAVKNTDVNGLTRIQVACMTEKTQMDYFGCVVRKHFPRSIHGRPVDV